VQFPADQINQAADCRSTKVEVYLSFLAEYNFSRNRFLDIFAGSMVALDTGVLRKVAKLPSVIIWDYSFVWYQRTWR